MQRIIRVVKPDAMPVIVERLGRRRHRYEIEDTVKIDLSKFDDWVEDNDDLKTKLSELIERFILAQIKEAR